MTGPLKVESWVLTHWVPFAGGQRSTAQSALQGVTPGSELALNAGWREYLQARMKLRRMIAMIPI
jgi:hypothetical protein